MPVTPPIFEPPTVDSPGIRDALFREEHELDARATSAKKLIRRYTYWALGLGAIPIPFVDAVGVFGAQIKMLRELSRLYGVEFSEARTKAIVSALISTIGGGIISITVVGSLLKLIPVVGAGLSLVAMPAVGAAVTLTLGNIFMMHFESGGTLLDFDAEAMREHFKSEFQKSKLVVEEIRRNP